ncbi:hypothetical protein [Streptomyces sp. NBC_01304]|uniref:hypothetical protein n=1 Tax=Streptomyces sp. NBC_01304 TaxID=2903818 RepID=UPI002E11C672|nr:hypothetical protein OG430_32315 [Streptomyces sp. NBC_01304]
MSTATKLRQGRDLVDDALFNRLVDFLAEEEGLEPSMAERRMDQGIAFVWTMGTLGRVMSPSKQIDPAWHAFILHTEAYRE